MFRFFVETLAIALASSFNLVVAFVVIVLFLQLILLTTKFFFVLYTQLNNSDFSMFWVNRKKNNTGNKRLN